MWTCTSGARKHIRNPCSWRCVLRRTGCDAKDISVGVAGKTCRPSSSALEPVIVAWDGRPSSEASTSSSRLVESHARSGRRHHAAWPPRSPLPHWISPASYHHLKGANVAKASLSLRRLARISPSPKKPGDVFAPLYALHSKRSFGAGDLTDLESLIDWTSDTRRTCAIDAAIARQLSSRALRAQPLLANQPAVLERVLHRSRKGARVVGFTRRRRAAGRPRPRLDRHSWTIANNAREASGAGSAGESILYQRRAKSVGRISRSIFADNPEAREYARFRARTDRARAGAIGTNKSPGMSRQRTIPSLCAVVDSEPASRPRCHEAMRRMPAVS